MPSTFVRQRAAFAFIALMAPTATPIAPLAAQDPPLQQDAPLHVDVNLVNVFVSVTDRNGAIVGGLNREDFSLTEDDRPQRIAIFEGQSDIPLNLTLAIDTSESVAKDLASEQRAARRFVREVLRTHDQLSLVQFASTVGEPTPFTNNVTKIERSIARLRGGGGTAITSSRRACSNAWSYVAPYRKNMLDCRGPAADFSDPAWFQDLAAKLGRKKWYVHAGPPFGGPAHVLRYLGRYTHRMAISNHRLLAFDAQKVSFLWRDYAHGNKQRVMTLDAVEFLRRFFLHVLPLGFVRIRHYGLLSNRFRKQLLPLAHTLLAAQGREQLPLPPPPDCDLWHCPRCGRAMRVVQRFTAAQLYFAGFDTS